MTKQTTFLGDRCLATASKGPCALGELRRQHRQRAGGGGGGDNDIHTHMHERAIGDAVGDDTDSPICDSGDLGLLRLLNDGRLSYPRLQVVRYERSCGHSTWFSVVADA